MYVNQLKKHKNVSGKINCKEKLTYSIHSTLVIISKCTICNNYDNHKWQNSTYPIIHSNRNIISYLPANTFLMRFRFCCIPSIVLKYWCHSFPHLCAVSMLLVHPFLSISGVPHPCLNFDHTMMDRQWP